jgi:hypothetical protein
MLTRKEQHRLKSRKKEGRKWRPSNRCNRKEGVHLAKEELAFLTSLFDGYVDLVTDSELAHRAVLRFREYEADPTLKFESDGIPGNSSEAIRSKTIEMLIGLYGPKLLMELLELSDDDFSKVMELPFEQLSSLGLDLSSRRMIGQEVSHRFKDVDHLDLSDEEERKDQLMDLALREAAKEMKKDYGLPITEL